MFRLGTATATIQEAAGRIGYHPGEFLRIARSRSDERSHWSLVEEIDIVSNEPEFTAEQVGWRFAIGTIILIGAYIAWPIIPFVMATDWDPGFKAGLAGLLGATPFLSKFVAVAVMGRPAYYFLKRNVYARLRRRFAGTPAE
jgi:hypothetical protein